MSNSEVFKPSLIRNAWRNELVKMNYNTLATLQPPMRNRYMMDSRLKHFSEHQRIDGLFYSVEYNADRKSGYHIHLMFKDLCNLSKEKKECTSEHLAWALDINKSYIQYYKPINSNLAVQPALRLYNVGGSFFIQFSLIPPLILLQLQDYQKVFQSMLMSS
jgi:hypothetical protein